jgi:predicted kinase
MNDTYFNLVPQSPDFVFAADDCWQAIPALRALDGCPQSPVHHAEGDVGVHMRMVCEWLSAAPQWRELDESARRVVFWAALLHDLAKPACTGIETDGQITSRGHSRRSEIMARGLLWSLDAPFAEREMIANIIRFHQLPFFLVERADAPAKLYELSQTARCDLLALVAEADARGRVCQDQQRLFDNIELFCELAREENCFAGPRQFPSDHSRFLYFHRANRDPNYLAFDDTICEVTLMAGLPGAGKSAWAAAHLADKPQICLDDLRREMGVKPTENQGPVVQAARERARKFLRQRRDFVWNATSLTRQHREQNIGLFAAYNARVRIVYVEAPEAVLFRQNAARDAAVPVAAIRKMIDRWETPDLTEAHQIEYVLTSL